MVYSADVVIQTLLRGRETRTVVGAEKTDLSASVGGKKKLRELNRLRKTIETENSSLTCPCGCIAMDRLSLSIETMMRGYKIAEKRNWQFQRREYFFL